MVEKYSPIEFNCMDCGIHVYALGYWQGNPRCAQCIWLSGIKDPVERERLRQFLKDIDDTRDSDHGRTQI